MSINYFRFKRERVLFYLDESACTEHGVKPESAAHPHVIMEARPTFGCTQFIRDQRKLLPIARAKARGTLEVDRIRERVKAMTPAEVKEDIDALADPSTRTKLDLEDHYVSALEHLSPEVQDASYRLLMTTVAVCVRQLGGDFRCYSETWGATPEWPALDTDGALETRMVILAGLSETDLGRLHKLAKVSLEVPEEDEKK